MHRTPIWKIAFFLFTCLISSAHAKDKWYRVEVIIFETKDKNALAEEWPLNPGIPNYGNTISLHNDTQTEFGLLPDNQYALNDAKKKIQKKYRVVTHTAWRQLLNEKEQAQRVHLTGGKQYSSQSLHEIEGFIRFSGGRYLNVDTDMLYRKPVKILSSSNDTAHFAEASLQDNTHLQLFRMKNSSRLKIDEIQYLDHPVYGMIIMVRPEKA